MILDGGMGTELYECGATECYTHPLWSTIVTQNSPEIVTNAHSNFIHAGADIIITNTYRTNPPLVQEKLKCSKEEAENLVLKTIHCAVKAREACQKSTIIAGSIGPYPGNPGGAYKPDYLKETSVHTMAQWHEPRFRLLANSSNVDILAVETIPGLAEAAALFQLMDKFPKDCFVSFACADFKTNAGESFAEIANFLKEKAPKSLKGIGINCSHPDQVAEFGRVMGDALPTYTLIAYPNTGEKWSRTHSRDWSNNPGRWNGTSENIAEFIPSWRRIGFKWIGGCCRVTPDQIAEIKQNVDLHTNNLNA